MRICSTLDLPDAGDVLVDGRSVIEEPRHARRRLGFMPDSFGTYPNTTIRDYLDFYARAYGLRGVPRRDTTRHVMEFTGLADLAGKEISALSKGMKQRLCLAKTLLHDPAILILDEPAAGLDPRARVELRELVKSLAGLGKAVLVSSHILTELAEMCDSVTMIERGQVKATGDLGEVARSLRPHVRIFVRTLSDAAAAERFLLETPGISAVRPDQKGHSFDYEGDSEGAAALLAALVAAGLRPVEFATRAVNLEDLFLELTEGKIQ
jgi:ABC-2 type transport system ATP-binding protein